MYYRGILRIFQNQWFFGDRSCPFHSSFWPKIPGFFCRQEPEVNNGPLPSILAAPVLGSVENWTRPQLETEILL